MTCPLKAGEDLPGRVMLMDQDTQWLYQLLVEVQLDKFYIRVRDGLNITRIEHFSYVKESDLEQIGISKPGESLLLNKKINTSLYSASAMKTNTGFIC